MNFSDPLDPAWSTVASSSSSAIGYISPDILVPTHVSYPFYHAHRESLIPALPDKYLSVIVPLVVYWAASLFFTIADNSNSRFFEPYRLHEPEEVKKRNKVTPREVVVAVIWQQVVQTLMGLVVLEDEKEGWGALRDHRASMRSYAPWVIRAVRALVGQEWGDKVLVRYGAGINEWVYWWGVPIAQFFLATLILDAWQYFWHRLFHTSTFLYRHIHSLHHRLYVPYAYGALYNHPIEGFILDSAGALVSHLGSFMTIRQATLFFAISTAKTVDDHCGFALPWDPMQIFFANTSATHDVHHQIFGLKKNFSQPFYVNWDLLMGTYMDPKLAPKKKAYTDKRDPKVQEKLGEEEKKKLM